MVGKELYQYIMLVFKDYSIRKKVKKGMEQAISAAEWQVMRVLWAHPGSTSLFIIQALEDGFDWQPATIKTLLGRLRKKNYLSMEKVDTRYHYWPLVGEGEHLNLQVQTILENSCSTKNVDLVRHLLQVGSYSKADLEDIQKEIRVQIATAGDRLVCHCLPGQCTCGHHH